MEIMPLKSGQFIVQSYNKYCIDFQELSLKDMFHFEHHQKKWPLDRGSTKSVQGTTVSTTGSCP